MAEVGAARAYTQSRLLLTGLCTLLNQLVLRLGTLTNAIVSSLALVLVESSTGSPHRIHLLLLL